MNEIKKVRDLRQVIASKLGHYGMVQTYGEIDKRTLDDGLQCVIDGRCYHITITEQ